MFSLTDAFICVSTHICCRDKVEQEDYQERIVLQLAEQEEEDFNRIKEESIRRRQAILDKYKTKPLQQQPRLGDIGKVSFV